MDFSTSPRQREIAQRMAAIGRELHDPTLAERDRQWQFSPALWQRLAQHRVHVGLAPAAQGGLGWGALDLVFALEALGEQCPDTGVLFALAAHLCACVHPLAAFGDAAQREHWLPRIARQGLIGAHAITEIEAGSDIAAMSTLAERCDDGYRLSGHKCYITNAPVCDFIIVHARTGQRGGFLDYSCFIIDRSSPGVSVSAQPHEKLGLRTAAMGDIDFDGVFVPAAQRLGAEGGGGAIFHASMDWERTCLFALYLGVMKRQLRQTLGRAEQRVQFGQPLVEHQAVGHRIADMQLRLEAARLACLKAAWGLDHDQHDAGAAIVAKLLVSQASVQNSLDALQIHGASGVLGGEIERQLRNAVPTTLFSGASEVLKNQLLRRLRSQARREARETREVH